MSDNDNGDVNRKNRDCWKKYCCPGRCGFFTPLAIGCVVAFSILSFFFSLWAWQSSQYVGGQTVYVGDGIIIGPSPYASVFAAVDAPKTYRLPNNLIEYIGGVYSIDCISPLGHSIAILHGVLNTTWDGVNTVAKCNPGHYNAGFMFRVLSQSSIRIIDPDGMTFLP
jgi:hypothetical protein